MNISKRFFATGFCISAMVVSHIADTNAQTVPKEPPAQAPVKANFVQEASYDPLAIESTKVKTLELKVQDAQRGRKVPALIYLPSSTDPAPVIIHSHGLGGKKETSSFLGKHWAARGYVAIFLQHPGSDDSIWKDNPPRQVMRALKKAANGENLVLRNGDVRATIDKLEKWNVEADHPLSSRLDLQHIGMSGHSFGAVTTQSVSGQKAYGGNQTDQRIRAAIPMSPSQPRFGDPVKAFRDVKIPWLCMTGTRDEGVIGGATPKTRLEVYKALPDGDKFQLVLHDAEHLVFTETQMKRGPYKGKKRNPNHHPAIKAITTAFWDTYLRKDEAAKAWISDKQSVRGVLEPKDVWQSK